MIPALTIGVDISSKHLDCASYDSAAQLLSVPIKYKNNHDGISSLLAHAPASAVLIAEPTGRYGYDLIRMATEMGREVRLAPTRQAKSYLKAMSSRVKSDRVDSAGLARFGTAKELQAYKLKSQNVERIDQLLSARKLLSQSVSQLDQQNKELHYAAEALAPAIADLRARIKNLDNNIAALTKDDPDYAAIGQVKTVPGVGQVTAVAVVSRVAAKKFKSADAFVAYCGLDVKVNESGARKGKVTISKEGDAEMRRLFYCCAQASLRCKNGPYEELYNRLRSQGQPTTKALVAVARKIARVCWSIATYRTEYNQERVHNQAQAVGGADSRFPNEQVAAIPICDDKLTTPLDKEP